MIFKKDYLNRDLNYLQEEKKGLNNAINKLDKRFKNGEVDREKFLKQNQEFANKQIELNKKIQKLNK